MKPITTWILVANASTAFVLDHRGPAHGMKPRTDLVFQADEPAEFSDGPTVGHHRRGHGRHAFVQTDVHRHAEEAFAELLANRLKDEARSGAFERLVIAAAPHMLGSLRAAMAPEMSARIIAELPKDLTQVPLKDMPAHLEEHLLV